MQTNFNFNNNKNKLMITNIEFPRNKKSSDLSMDNLHSSNYSTKLTNTNIYNKINTNLQLNMPLLINKNYNYNTINEYSDEDLYLSKLNLECDMHISSLKKQLEILKKDRKKVELNVKNIKKKINELQDKEIKSFKQVEYTKKYIDKIMKNSKNNLNKKYGINFPRKNNINQNLRNNQLNNNANNYKTWVGAKKYIHSLKKNNLSHLACQTAIKNNYINDTSIKKLNSNRNIIKSQNLENVEYFTNVKNCASPITNKIYIKKNITSIRKSKHYQNIKDNLIKVIRKDIDEKLKIEREIENINKEQNKLYNSFYEDFVVLRSAKTLDLE
jgi:hypothetical protein